MGTLAHDRFTASIMGYAGGYQNKMDVAGRRDTTSNWLAGAAAKAAYTVDVNDNFSLQPYALAMYNAFGDQQWTSDYGDLRMEVGSFNGWNVAPGIAAIYNGDAWSAHASAQYTVNFNNKVKGKAGDIDLAKTDTGDGYAEYGLGFTRKITDSLSFEGKATLRNGNGMEGYGGHIGLSWKF